MTPALLLIALAAEAVPQAPPPSPAPYRQKLPDGSIIDWHEGRVVVTGRARIVYDIERSDLKARLTSLKAEGEGRVRLMDLVGGLSLDGAARFGDDPERVRMARLKLQKVKSVSQSKDQPGWLTARLELPLWGDGGVLEWLLGAEDGAGGETSRAAGGAPAASAPAATGPAAGDHDGWQAPSGLIVDARHLEGEAAPSVVLLPRIVDEQGRVLHGVATAGPSAARVAGLLAYAVGAPPDPNRSDAAVSRAPTPPPREGVSPLRVTAVAAGGPGRADIVVSVADGELMQQAGLRSGFLKECRVVVLMPPPPRPPFPVVTPRNREQRDAPTDPRSAP